MNSNQKILVSFCLGTFIVFSLFILSNLVSVFAQYTPEVTGTTANVSVSGYLENILVWHHPVNFSTTTGRQPGAEWPKVNADGVGYITINMSDNTNIIWNVYMNASDLISVSGDGTPMVPSESPMEIWTDFSGCTLENNPANLTYGLIEICTDLDRSDSIKVYFNLTIPVAQYNDTYYGDLWIYVNSTYDPPGEENDRAWYGDDSTTITIHKYIEFWWNLSTVNIDFATLTPGTGFGGIPSANATGPDAGFPAKMTNGDGTNIFIDIYMLGTDLKCLNDADACWTTPLVDIYNISIGWDGNLTYSNATNTSTLTWTDNIFKYVDYDFQAPPNLGDFANWHLVPNYTNQIPVYWNISIPTDTEQGTYGGEITATAVDVGEAP